MYYGERLYVDLAPASAQARAPWYRRSGFPAWIGLNSPSRRRHTFYPSSKKQQLNHSLDYNEYLAKFYNKVESIWMNCICIFWKISRTCCQRKALVWDCKFPSTAESLLPTDWMTWAVTWLHSVSSLVRSARVFSRVPVRVKCNVCQLEACGLQGDRKLAVNVNVSD